MYGGQNTHLPMKANANGVLPLIFAMTIMQFPEMIMQFFRRGGNFMNFWYRWMVSSPKVYVEGTGYMATSVFPTPGVEYVGAQYAPYVYYIIYFVLIIAFAVCSICPTNSIHRSLRLPVLPAGPHTVWRN